MLNFHQFRIFYHAARHMNFTRAAETLFISQPAVTIQIKALEADCGFKLFKKKGRKKWLTDEGRLLFDHAKTVFALEKEVETAIDDFHKLKKGVLRIGTTKAYARYFMPPMLSSFISGYPGIKVKLNEGSSLDMTRSLLNFDNEIAIIARVKDIPGVRLIPFRREEMVVALPVNHPLACKKSITFGELADEPFIMKETGSGTRRLADRLFANAKLQPKVLMETSNTEFIKQLILRGDGVSFLVKAAVAAELAEKSLTTVPLADATHYLDVSIAHLEDQPLSPSAGAFLDLLKEIKPDPAMSFPLRSGTSKAI